MSLTLTKVKVRDRSFEVLLGKTTQKDHDGVCAEAAKLVDQFCEVPVDGRILYLTQAQRREVEKVMDISLANGDELVKAIRHQALFKIGETEIVLTPSQAAFLQEQASFYNQTPKDWIEKTAKIVLEEILGRA